MSEVPDYISILAEEFESRRRRNPRFSLRAFAKSLEISPSVLSRTMRGESRLSPQVAERIAVNLKLGTEATNRFVGAARRLHERSKMAVALPTITTIAPGNIGDFFSFDYMVIGAALMIKELAGDPRKIADRLSFDPDFVAVALRRLIEIGVAEEVDGVYRPRKNNQFHFDASDESWAATKRTLIETLGHVRELMVLTTRATLAGSAGTFPCRREDLPKMRARVHAFHREMMQDFSSQDADTVAHIFSNVSLVGA